MSSTSIGRDGIVDPVVPLAAALSEINEMRAFSRSALLRDHPRPPIFRAARNISPEPYDQVRSCAVLSERGRMTRNGHFDPPHHRMAADVIARDDPPYSNLADWASIPFVLEPPFEFE